MDEMVQGSEAWFQARLAKVTASRIADVIAKTKTGPSASRANYLAELVCERLTGERAEGFQSAEMRWGNEQEPFARASYEFLRDVSVQEVGFVDHPRIPMSGASPDGLVGHDGLIEIKCPNTSTHIAFLTGGAIPAKYVTQMQWQMACTGRAWCDFVSFDPRMPAELRTKIERVQRDPATIVSLEGEVRAFLAELDATVERLRAMGAAA